jgi:hypothetical protein
MAFSRHPERPTVHNRRHLPIPLPQAAATVSGRDTPGHPRRVRVPPSTRSPPMPCTTPDGLADEPTPSAMIKFSLTGLTVHLSFIIHFMFHWMGQEKSRLCMLRCPGTASGSLPCPAFRRSSETPRSWCGLRTPRFRSVGWHAGRTRDQLAEGSNGHPSAQR